MKIAIKKLTPSDLSFFRVHVKASKQKAINLNQEVFIGRFFPQLENHRGAIKVSLSVFGPGGRAAHYLTRKVIRGESGKNWRLNGEVVSDPIGEDQRYDGLTQGDFAVLAFGGPDGPDPATMILVSSIEDPDLHGLLSEQMDISGRHTMIDVSETWIASLRNDTLDSYPAGHPFDSLVMQDSVEDVLFSVPANQVAKDGRANPLTPEALQLQLLAAEATGRKGEEVFCAWLVEMDHDEDDFEWVSQTHARAAFDFEIHKARWMEGEPHVFVDVKATRGSFSRPIHMSIAELRFAASQPGYRIARVHDVDGLNPGLKILGGVSEAAGQIIAALKALPEGVAVDSVQLEVKALPVEWEGTIA